MSAKTPEEVRNEQVIRSLYALAEGNVKDTSKFVSIFTDDGYFYDVAADKKYFGRDIGVTVDVYAAAFPDMHREIQALRSCEGETERVRRHRLADLPPLLPLESWRRHNRTP